MERGTEIVVEMLGKGIAQAEVARIVGCTESAVSQVATAYASRIAESQALSSGTADMLSDSLDAIEEMVLTKIKATIPLETDLMKLTKVLHVVNSAKRRSKGEGMPAAGNVTINNQQVVSLQLPKHLRKQVEYTTNPQNEVVEINGKCLSIASNKQVERLAGLSTDEEDNSNGQIHRQPSSPQPLLSRARNGQDNLGLSEEDFASATVIDSTTETYEAVKDS